MITIGLKQAYEDCIDVLMAGHVPMLSSSPGLGKSALAKKIAKDYDLCLIDLRLSQCDPTDLMGFPFLSSDKKSAGYVPMNFFPTENTPIPEGYKGWLVLLDEFNSAPLAVQAAAYKILLDHMVGQEKLHKKTLCIAAGNLQTDGAIVNRMGTATQSRLVHFILKANHLEFIEWGEIEGEIDHRVLSFIRYRPELLHKFDPNHNDMTFPCPRTWEFTSDIIKRYSDAIPRKKLAVLAGTLGEGVGREFLEFTHIYGELPSIEQIMANPETIQFSNEPSNMFALAGMLPEHLETKTAPTLMKFIQRLPVEFQFISLKTKIKKDQSLMQVPEIRDWAIRQAKDLV